MRALAFVAAALLASGAPLPGYAVDDVLVRTEECGNTPNGGVILCAFDADGNIVSVSTSVVPINLSTTRSVGTSPAKRYVPYDRVVPLPDGGFCVTTAYREEGVTPSDGISTAPGAHPGGNGFNDFYNLAPCPARPAVQGEAAPIETAAMIAARYWEQIPLPIPRPAIAPGRAITGKLAYLETNGETNRKYTSTSVAGELEIQATGTYTVNWGDGTTTGPHSFEGKPWPNGMITHDYVDVGKYGIIVTERWTATWRLGGSSGTLRTLQTQGRIDNFPVEQIQAVIAR